MDSKSGADGGLRGFGSRLCKADTASRHCWPQPTVPTALAFSLALKVSLEAESSKFARPLASCRLPGRTPREAEHWLSLRLSQPLALLLGHSDRSRFTSTCSWQRKQKKASSPIIQRHLPLIGKLSAPPPAPGEPPAPSSASLPLRGDPQSGSRVPQRLGEPQLKCPGAGVGQPRAPPASPPRLPRAPGFR